MKIVMAILMIYDDDYSDDGNDFLTLKNPRKVVVTLLFWGISKFTPRNLIICSKKGFYRRSYPYWGEHASTKYGTDIRDGHGQWKLMEQIFTKYYFEISLKFHGSKWIWCISRLISFTDTHTECDISVSKLLGFETFQFFLMVSVSVSKNFGIEKSIGIGFAKFWYR